MGKGPSLNKCDYSSDTDRPVPRVIICEASKKCGGRPNFWEVSKEGPVVSEEELGPVQNSRLRDRVESIDWVRGSRPSARRDAIVTSDLHHLIF